VGTGNDPFGLENERNRREEYFNRFDSASNESAVIIQPQDRAYRDIVVPQRFGVRVISHIIAPYLKNDAIFKSPMFLALVGKAGEGKTAQAIATCSQHGFYVVYCSAANLSGKFESDAKAGMELLYRDALKLRKNNKFAVIIIDDFQKSVVNTNEKIEKTINTELLTGYLMNLTERKGEEKIPIILTANDLTDIYQPLLRFGRTDVFMWEPTQQEKLEIVTQILSIVAGQKVIAAFFKEYSQEPISFFAQLLNRWRIMKLEQLLYSFSVIDKSVLRNIEIALDDIQERSLKYDDLIQLALSAKSERGVY